MGEPIQEPPNTLNNKSPPPPYQPHPNFVPHGPPYPIQQPPLNFVVITQQPSGKKFELMIEFFNDR